QLTKGTEALDFAQLDYWFGGPAPFPSPRIFSITLFMARSISVKRKKRGRPATGTDPLVGTRMSHELIRLIDAWAANTKTTRSETIRRLVEQALLKDDPDQKQAARKPGSRAPTRHAGV